MAGTKVGGIKAAATNKAIHGEDFYARIGAKGGLAGHTGGFASMTPCECDLKSVLGEHHKAQCAGYRGGLKSRRTKSKV